MTKPDFRILLRELLQSAIQIESDGDPAGHFWEITMTDERMTEFENMGLWNMETAIG